MTWIPVNHALPGPGMRVVVQRGAGHEQWEDVGELEYDGEGPTEWWVLDEGGTVHGSHVGAPRRWRPVREGEE